MLGGTRRRQIIDLLAGFAGHDEEAMLEAVLAIVRDDAVCRRLDGAERRAAGCNRPIRNFGRAM